MPRIRVHMPNRNVEGAPADSDLLHAVIEGVTDIIFVKDLSGRYVFMNSAGVELIGRPLQEILGKEDSELFPDDIAAGIVQTDQEVLSTGEPHSFEVRVAAAGEPRIFFTTKSLYRDAQGRPAGVIGIARDVTTAKEVARALADSEERRRKIFDHSNDAIFIVDPAGDEILEVNPAACRMLGYTREELLTKPVSEVYPSEMPALLAFAERVFEKGSGWTDELTCLTKSGNILPAEVSASMVDIDKRNCLIALVRDISERRRAEAALREKEERFRRLVNHTADGLFLVARDGRIVDVNESACASLGYTREDLLGMCIPEIGEVTIEDFQRLGEGRSPGEIVTVESRHRRKDGTEFPVEVRIAFVRWSGEELLLGLARDITERKRAEAASRQSEERLSRIVESAMDAIVLLDQQRSVRLLNQSAERMFGYGTAKVLGQSFDRFASEPFRDLLRSHIGASGPGFSHSYMWVPEGLTARRADGEEFPIEGTLSTVELGGERLFTVILRDVNARKQAEAELTKLRLEKLYLQEELHDQHNFGEILGRSPAMKRIFQDLESVARTDSTVLITGETGTGKELIARALHHASDRQDKVMVKVNCAALPGGLIESELFGHEKGAFTGAISRKIGRFELAHRGTIFLDEIGDLSLELQTKLLRVLQDGEFERLGSSQTLRVDVRVIAATNQDLEEAIEAGRFRADLFYRLNVFPIPVPPLRQRKEDIQLLAEHFVARYSRKLGKKIERIPQAAMDALLSYSWPGNIRELENVIERAMILSRGEELELGDWFARTSGEREPTRAAKARGPGRVRTMDDVQRQHILEVLEGTGWRISGERGAARLLSMKPNTLRARMKKLGIRRGH